jgi:hypothetical protein
MNTLILLAHVSSQTHVHPRDAVIIIIGLILIDWIVNKFGLIRKIRS